MNCSHCGVRLARTVQKANGHPGIDDGDTLISAHTLVVIKGDGRVAMKCPACKTMIPVWPVFAVSDTLTREASRGSE